MTYPAAPSTGSHQRVTWLTPASAERPVGAGNLGEWPGPAPYRRRPALPGGGGGQDAYSQGSKPPLRRLTMTMPAMTMPAMTMPAMTMPAMTMPARSRRTGAWPPGSSCGAPWARRRATAAFPDDQGRREHDRPWRAPGGAGDAVKQEGDGPGAQLPHGLVDRRERWR